MKKFRLLTTAIVTALDRSNPTSRGTVWEPEEVIDVQEAEALVNIGIAEQTRDEVTAQTISQRQAAKADDVEEADDGDVETDISELLAGNVDEVAFNIAQAIDDDQLTQDQLKELLRLESEGKNRKGVADAIAAYIEE